MELTKYTAVSDAQTPYYPFIFQTNPGIHTTADYWMDEFGAPDESTEDSIYIASFIQAAVIFYSLMQSLDDCIQQELSFYFLVLTETLFIHYNHDSNPWIDNFDYGDQLAFNDTMDCYIDNVYCAALLKSIPSMSQSQDIENYEALNLKSGRAIFVNIADPMTMRGRLDDLITRKLYGNDARAYYLDHRRNVYDYARSELIDLAAFTIDDYDISLQEAAVDLKDKRGAQEIDIPFELFNYDDYPDIDDKYIGKVIPFGYGWIRTSEAIPTNGNGDEYEDVVYRQATEISILGTVQLKIDDEWITFVPDSVDLTRGEFTIYADDARNAQGVPYECRVLGSTLILNNYASDIIIDLNERFLGILYTKSAYNRTEWEEEETALAPIGILWTEQLKIYDAIAQIQNRTNVGFRYEINASGKRTIRIDDNEREAVMHIPHEDIQNITELPVESDKDLLASVVHVNYSHDYIDDGDYYIENDDNEEYVLQNYRQKRKLITIDTGLTTQSDAEERGAWHAARFADPPKILTVELRGKDYYFLRIFDIVTIEITPAKVDASSANILAGREYYGFWKCKILAIDPNVNKLINNGKMQLIEKIEAIDYLIVDHNDALLSFGREETAVIKWGGRGA